MNDVIVAAVCGDHGARLTLHNIALLYYAAQTEVIAVSLANVSS